MNRLNCLLPLLILAVLSSVPSSVTASDKVRPFQLLGEATENEKTGATVVVRHLLLATGEKVSLKHTVLADGELELKASDQSEEALAAMERYCSSLGGEVVRDSVAIMSPRTVAILRCYSSDGPLNRHRL